MPGYYIVNGKYFTEDQLAISPENRSYRYGDGLFETIRLANGKIPLWELHARRLFSGLEKLRIYIPKLFTAAMLHDQLLDLCRKNNLQHARVRINVSRGDSGILEKSLTTPQYSIQTWTLDDGPPRFNDNGLELGIFPQGSKSMDEFSNLKSNNYLLYVMAALYASDTKRNDALVMNSMQRIADTSIANIYWVKADKIFTPPLTEGPVNGVMRTYLRQNIDIVESSLDVETLRRADEVFISNAVRGIQWVKSVENMQFQSCRVSSSLYSSFIQPLFS